MPRQRRNVAPAIPGAQEWLRAQLEVGPKNPFVLWREGAEVGLTATAINAAFDALGVVLTPSTPPGPEWRLPDIEQRPEERP